MKSRYVTKVEIFEAADLLAELGIMPSVSSVRDAMGNRGSASTICPILKKWSLQMLATYTESQQKIRALEEQNESLCVQLKECIDMCNEIKDRINPNWGQNAEQLEMIN